VRLLMEDYEHFTNSPETLNTQLDCLVKVHGRDKIDSWHELATSGRMPELVDALLVDHYDPAYLRSIDRNFIQFGQAQVLELADISKNDFIAAARSLHP
jgi:tRNA 2-selenouridine synthase